MPSPLASALHRLGGGVALVGLLLGALAAGCSADEGGEEPDRRIEIYAVVLDWLLEREEFTVAEGEPDDVPTVFVDHLNRDIDLEVQVGLVARFEDRYELRFVDAVAEAVDVEAPRSPVRNEAVLVGLGSIPDAAPYLVRGEVYRNLGSIDAYRFQLVQQGDDWVLRDGPEPVEPEGFVPGE